MIRQDAAELQGAGYPFDKFACKLFTLYHFDEQLNGTYYDAEAVINTTAELTRRGWIKEELSIYEKMKGQNYTRLICNYLGIPAVDVVYKPASYQCQVNELEILKLWKPGFSHFVPGNGRSDYSWDSLGIRRQQKDYILKSKRIIKL